MTRGEAVIQLLRDGRAEKSSLTSYKRALRCAAALELSDDERKRLLGWLEYVDANGFPYAWLARALAK